jgi:hypothetical protein
MKHDPLTWFFVASLAFLGVYLYSRLPYKEWYTEQDRRRSLAALARKLRMQFHPNLDFEFARRYLFLSWLNRKATFYWSAYVLAASGNFPELLISHESRESRVPETPGEAQIAFESAGFSRTFRVRAADKKFASDICCPRLLEFLQANKDLTLEIRGNAVAVLFEDWLHPDKVERDLARIGEIRKLLPAYLFAGN